MRFRDFVGPGGENYPPLTRRARGGDGWFRGSLSELVELMGIEPMTS